MEDHLAIQIGHWIWAIFITGGGSGAVIAWWLTSRKKPKPSHDGCAKALDEHKAIDIKSFERVDSGLATVNSHLEKQYTILLDVTGDLGKIKGKMNIQ